jgi:hypothetical protein
VIRFITSSRHKDKESQRNERIVQTTPQAAHTQGEPSKARNDQNVVSEPSDSELGIAVLDKGNALGDGALELGDALLDEGLLLVRDGADGEDLGDAVLLWKPKRKQKTRGKGGGGCKSRVSRCDRKQDGKGPEGRREGGRNERRKTYAQLDVDAEDLEVLSANLLEDLLAAFGVGSHGDVGRRDEAGFAGGGSEDEVGELCSS